MSSKFKKMFFLSLLVIFGIPSCNGCDDERILDDIVSLELNFQVCTDVSAFSSRGLTIRWEGHLRSASSGATSGETSFSIPSSVLNPLPESPSGRSWFRSANRVENLRAGEWDIEVEYFYPAGVGADIHERVEFLGSNSVYFTHGNDDASTSGFPECP